MPSLARHIAVRPGEGRLVALVAGAFAAIEMGRGLGELGVDTLVLTRIGQSALPPLYVALGAVGLAVSLAYGAALARSRSEGFFPALLLVLAAILAIEWLVALSGSEAIVPLLWVSVYAAGMLLLTVIWTVAGAVFDARQAKRLFPLLTSAAIVGSLSGFLGAIVVQRLVGAEQLILAEAALFACAAALLAGLGSRLRPRRGREDARPSIRAALTTGAAYVARSPLMRLVAVAYVLLAILMFSVTFPFMTAMSAAFPDEGELLAALALFSTAVTIASFLIGVLLANRIFARVGIATAAVLLPLVYILGFGAWLVRFGLATAIAVRFAQQVTQRGISNAAWGAFFNVVPARRRGPVMAFIDGVPGQAGTVISGVALMLASRDALEPVFVLGLVTAVACLVVVVLIRRAYGRSLVTTLRSGLAEQVLEGGRGLAALSHEPGVLAALREIARSEVVADRRLAAELLVRSGDESDADTLVELAGDPDADVRAAAVAGLARSTSPAIAEALQRALEDPAAAVRVAAIRALASSGARMPEALRATDLSSDPDPRVRAEVAVALGRDGHVESAKAIVAALVRDAAPEARGAGLDAIARLDVPLELDAVGPLRHDPSAQVRAAALRASAAHPSAAHPSMADAAAANPTAAEPPDGVAIFLDAFDDPSAEVRSAAAAAVCHRPRGVAAALEVLGSGAPIEQETALEALIGHEEAARPGLIAWADREVARAAELRRRSAILAHAAPTSTASYLGVVLGQRADAIIGRLLTALALLGAPEASGLIRRCLQSIDPEVRAQAIEALDSIGDARLARGVVRLLDSDASALMEDAPSVGAIATELLDERDAWVRALALRTLRDERPAERARLEARARADPDAVVRAAFDDEEGTTVEGDMGGSIRLVNDVDRMLVLRRVPIFAALDPEDLARVAALAVERRWAGEETVMAEGDVGSELVVIVDGHVRVVHTAGGDEHVLRRYGPGDHIGELAVLRAGPRAASVIAEEPGVRGLVIGGEAVHSLLRERPDAAMAMLATLADRISQQA